MEQHYDAVAADPQLVLLGGTDAPTAHAGELPRDRGTHLVTGTARFGGVKAIGSIPDGDPFSVHGSTLLCVGGRWLAVRLPDEVRLHDLHDGCRPGFCFRPPADAEVMSLHPLGEMLLVRRGERAGVCLPDGGELHWADLPGRRARWAVEELQFSACGKYVWFAGSADDGDKLWLLRSRDLAVLDVVACPHDSDPPDEPGSGWMELSLTHFPARNRLAVERTAGDSFLGVWFFRAERGKVWMHEEHLSIRAEGFDGESLDGLDFRRDGERFVSWGRYGQVVEWEWPTCKPTAIVSESAVCGSWDHGDLDAMAYTGDLLLASFADGELHVLQSGTLDRGCAPPLADPGQLLPNGLLLHAHGKETEVRRVWAGRPVPVVIELDSATGFARKVLRKQRGKWRDETAKAVHARSNFPLADA